MVSKFISMSATESPTLNNESLLRSYITGSRRISNIFWAVVVSLGGLGFFLTGLSSYFKTRNEDGKQNVQLESVLKTKK